MLETVDLITDPRPELWSSTVKFIQTETTDSLRSNYADINFSQFVSFPCVIDRGKIVCFSGLQFDQKKWGSNIARCSSRMWLHPAYRHGGLTKFTGGDKFLNTTYCVPVQIAKARELNLSAVFVSREKNPLGFKKYIDLIKTNCDLNFQIKPHRYNVCGMLALDQESCKQWVAVHELTEAGPGAWTDAMLKYIIAE